MATLRNIKAIRMDNHEEIPIREIDGSTPINRLIQIMIQNDKIPRPTTGQKYHIVKDNRQLDETLTLEQAGFEDDDSFDIVSKSEGA